MSEQSNEREFLFYVVAIPDEYRILINGGKEWNDKVFSAPYLDNEEDIVKVGDDIEVLIPGNEIIDPITKKSLGFYDYVKDVLEVTEIHDQFFECSKITRAKNSVIESLSPMFGASSTLEELDVNPDQILESITDANSDLISLGDPVRFI